MNKPTFNAGAGPLGYAVFGVIFIPLITLAFFIAGLALLLAWPAVPILLFIYRRRDLAKTHHFVPTSKP